MAWIWFKRRNTDMVLINLFLAFLRVGLFAIGGAYSFLPLMEKEIVERYHWLTKEEFLDVLGMVKIFPGAISIKYATYTGYKIAGVPGAIVANIGNLLAPSLLVIFASVFYAKYRHSDFAKGAFSMIELAIFAMILALAFQTVDIIQLASFRSLLVIVLTFFLFVYTKIHPALIIICAGILGCFFRIN